MDLELKNTIDDLAGAVEGFKEAHTRIEQLEAKGLSTDAHEAELAKHNDAIDTLSKAKADMEAASKAAAEKYEKQGQKLQELEKEFADLAKARGEKNPGDNLNPDVIAHKAAYNEWLRKGKGEAMLGDLQFKATSTLADADSGFAVPEEIDRSIIEYERTANPMRSVCRAISVSTPDYKKLVNLGGAASGWVGEEEERLETATPKLAQLPAFMGEIYANPASTQVSLEDPFFNVEDWIAREVAIEFADQENAAFTTGNGTNKPKGLWDYASEATTDKAGTRAFGTYEHVDAAGAALVGDELIDLIHSLRHGYRSSATWMMTNLTLAAARKLKDTEGNYLWRAGLEESHPDRLLGYGLVENEEVPELTDGIGAKPVAFGDFQRAYLIIDRIGTSVLRDPFTHKPYVHFYTRKRVGGMGTDSMAIKFLNISA